MTERQAPESKALPGWKRRKWLRWLVTVAVGAPIVGLCAVADHYWVGMAWDSAVTLAVTLDLGVSANTVWFDRKTGWWRKGR
jgi:hypothetical protein